MQEYFPSLDDFGNLSKMGNVVPIFKEIPAIAGDQVSDYLKIREKKYIKSFTRKIKERR